MTLTASFTEGKHAFEFLASEAERYRSRESVTVLSGQNLLAGHVVGKVSKVYGKAPVVAVVGTGDGTISNIRPGKLGKAGTYVITCTTAASHGGTFTVVDPDGVTIGTLVLPGTTGASGTFRSDQIEFTITDGSGDFIVGDAFSVVVTASSVPVAVGTGTGAMSAVSLGRNAEHGSYVLTCIATETHGGTFSVRTPSGAILPDFVMTAGDGDPTSYTSDHINFTITDATDFVAGDYFILPVLQAGGKVVEWDPTPTLYDGRHEAAGVLCYAVDATSADKAGVIIARDAEVEKVGLNWITGIVAGEKLAAYEQLAKHGIIAR